MSFFPGIWLHFQKLGSCKGVGGSVGDGIGYLERPGHRPVAVDAVRLFWTLPVTDSGPVCACVCHAAAPAEARLHRRPQAPLVPE